MTSSLFELSQQFTDILNTLKAINNGNRIVYLNMPCDFITNQVKTDLEDIINELLLAYAKSLSEQGE